MSYLKRVPFKQYIQEELSCYEISFTVKNYLTELLSSYIRSESFFDKKKGSVKYSEKWLLDLCQKNQQSSHSSEKIYLLKTIGDFSLYLSGFFRESLKKKITHLSYYENLGESAYYLIGQHYETRFNLFEELSKKFKNLSAILFSIQKKSIERHQLKYMLDFQNETSFLPISEKDKKLC